jgi:hypothetical protein
MQIEIKGLDRIDTQNALYIISGDVVFVGPPESSHYTGIYDKCRRSSAGGRFQIKMDDQQDDNLLLGITFKTTPMPLKDVFSFVCWLKDCSMNTERGFVLVVQPIPSESPFD